MNTPGVNLGVLAAFFLVTCMGVIAIAISLFRLKSKDFSLLTFGLFCSVSGFRLLILTKAIQPLTGPLLTSAAGDALLVYCLVIPLSAFMAQIFGRGIFDSMVWAFRFVVAYALVAVVYIVIFHKTMTEYAIYPPVVVLWCIVFILNVLAGRKRRDIELDVVRGVLVTFLLCIANDQLVSLRVVSWTLQLVQPGFLLLCVGLGFVAAHHFVFNEKKLLEIERDVEVARRIQYSNLPSKIHSPGGYAIAARYVPMSAVAGDFYAIQSSGASGLGIFIADVSGHGVGAALIGSMLNIAFASQSESISDPARVLTRTNRILQGRLENSFVTACSLYLDPAYGSLIYANAGHPPPLLWRAASKEMVRLSNAGTILGPFPDSVYENSTLELTQGDRIILYTDGIVETRSKRGELFGEEQLITFIEKHATDSAETTADRLIKHLFHWSGRDGNSSLDDDLTLVIVDLAGVRAVAPESQVHVIHFGKPF
jgi:hypothetical protein